MTDVLDLVRFAVAAPIGNSDHSSLSAVISMAQGVANLCVRRKVFLKREVIRARPWLDDQPRSSVRVTRISLYLMINAGMLLASSRRLIFGGTVIAFGLTGKSLFAVK